MNRQHRNYEAAHQQAQAAQKALILYLRELRAAFPRWKGEQEFQAGLALDPRACELAEAARRAWEVAEWRRGQLGCTPPERVCKTPVFLTCEHQSTSPAEIP